MSKVIELRQNRAALVAESRELIDKADAESRDLNSEENEQWLKYNLEIDKLGSDIDREERREHIQKLEDELKASVRKVVPSSSRDSRMVDDACRKQAFRSWLKAGAGIGLTSDERSACERAGYNPYSSSINVRAMGDGQTNAGSQLALPQYANLAQYVDNALKTYGNWFNTSTVMPTVNGVQIKIPTLNDTAQVAVITSEGNAVSPADMVTGSVTFNAYRYSTAVVFSLELLQDSLVDIEAWLARDLSIRLYRGLNGHFTTGSGSGQPTGITGAATASGVTLAGSGATGAFTADNLIDGVHTVDPLYRNGRCGWVFHDQTIGQIRKLKDNNGQYLWQVGGPATGDFTNPTQDRLLGYPVYTNNAMPLLGTAGHIVGVFGDLSKYYIRNVMEMQVQRNEYLYALNAQIAIILHARYDGNLVDAGTHPVVSFVNPS